MTKDQRDMIRDAFHEYSGMLAQHAMRYVYDSRTAERLVQETFTIACEKPEVFCTHEKPLAWLFAVLNNKIKQERTKTARQEEEYNDELNYQAIPDKEPLEYSLPAGLSKEEREILILHLEKELSFAEIAELKGIRADACRQKFKRAKDKCKKLMERPKK